MFIEHLETFNFRNLDRVSLDLQSKPVVLRGQNAQGKTNALEALYVCATGKSFRRAKPREMVRHAADTANIKARFVRQGVRHEVEVSFSSGRRVVRMDGRGVRRTSKLLEVVNVVAFFPDDLRIVKGSPEERRRFLDRAVANHRAEFVEATLAYHKTLKDRNALLRGASVDRQLLEVYDDQLVQHGTILHQCRAETLEQVRPWAQDMFQRVMKMQLLLELSLLPGLGESMAFTGGEFKRALNDSYPRDRARGLTHVGPHRADLAMFIGGQSARKYASQGQQRAIVLALKLAELRMLETSLGVTPILLLDDVSSELDQERTKVLFDAINELEGQVWVSTTGAAPLPLSAETQVFDVNQGMIRRDPARLIDTMVDRPQPPSAG